MGSSGMPLFISKSFAPDEIAKLFSVAALFKNDYNSPFGGYQNGSCSGWVMKLVSANKMKSAKGTPGTMWKKTSSKA